MVADQAGVEGENVEEDDVELNTPQKRSNLLAEDSRGGSGTGGRADTIHDLQIRSAAAVDIVVVKAAPDDNTTTLFAALARRNDSQSVSQSAIRVQRTRGHGAQVPKSLALAAAEEDDVRQRRLSLPYRVHGGGSTSPSW